MDVISRRRGLLQSYVNLASLELNLAILQRKQRIIAANANVETRLKLRPALADDDGTGRNDLPAVGFHASVLGIAVAPVLGGALTFLMCHDDFPSENFLNR